MGLVIGGLSENISALFLYKVNRGQLFPILFKVMVYGATPFGACE